MQMKRGWLFAAALGSITVLGCGDSSGSGIPGSKKVGNLSASELKSLCKSFSSKLARIDEVSTKVVCTAESLAAGDDCEDAVDDCIDDAGPADEIDCDEEADDIGGEDCDVTVKQMEACLNATVRLMEDWADELTCSTDPEDLESFGDPQLPEECELLQDECPEGLGD